MFAYAFLLLFIGGVILVYDLPILGAIFTCGAILIGLFACIVKSGDVSEREEE